MSNEPGRDIPVLYEQIATWFDSVRYRGLIEIEYLSLALERAPKREKMLDLGCGGGEPIARYFIEHGFSVTGVDTSPTMIGLCQRRFPAETWLLGDMCELKLEDRYDVIFAWDSFFHLDHASQRRMFPIFRDRSEPGGVLVFSTGPRKGVVYGNMEGHDFYHASFDPEEYRQLLAEHGFTVILNRIEDPRCGDRTVWAATHASPPITP
jgi:SAM-dependent methyltransferase